MAIKSNEPRKEVNNDFGISPTEFKPIENGGNRWLRITAIIVGIVLMLGAGGTYWFFYHSSPFADNKASSELEIYPQTPNTGSRASDIPLESQTTEEMDRSVRGEGHESVADNNSEASSKFFMPPSGAQSQKGKVMKIDAPQGKYYVIIASFIDNALATDYAEQLANKGVHPMILEPKNKEYYFRVAIEQGNNYADTNEKSEALKASYGTDIWVIKY